MVENERTYTTVNIPLELAARIDKLITKLGYANRAEFIREAVRKFIDQAEANTNEQRQ